MRSVLRQDYPSFEYLVQDGDSDDDTIEILSRYAPHLAYVDSTPDAGPADALARVIRRATGDILAYLNSDDVLLPGTLREVARLFRAMPAADVIYGNGVLIDAHDAARSWLRSDPWSIYALTLGVAQVVQPATFFRSSAYDRTTGFNAQNLTCWDTELMVDMALAGCRIMQVMPVLAAFRLHPESISGSGKGRSAHEANLARLFAKVHGRRPSTRDLYVARPALRVGRRLRLGLGSLFSVPPLPEGPLDRGHL